MKLGITGHQYLDYPDAWAWVRKEFERILGMVGTPLVGISSLAVGADQLFARAVLRHGGTLHAIIPFAGYEELLTNPDDRRSYDDLLARAAVMDILPRSGTDEASFLAAGQLVVRLADTLVAVWDGEDAAGLGGTGDIVRYAEQSKRRVIHLNPIERKVIER